MPMNSLKVRQHWFRYAFGAVRQHAMTRANFEPDLCHIWCHYAQSVKLVTKTYFRFIIVKASHLPFPRVLHDDVIKWKHFSCYWPFVRWIHRSPVNSPHKSQWRGALMFSLTCAWINGWVNNREAGGLRRYRTLLWRHCNETHLFLYTIHIKNWLCILWFLFWLVLATRGVTFGSICHTNLLGTYDIQCIYQKRLSYQYKVSHCKGKTVSRPAYL